VLGTPTGASEPAYQEANPVATNLPPCESSRQHDLLSIIRQLAFSPGAAPADAVIDIRDAIRQYEGEFADQD
jgi:hypothetical protein